MKSELIFRGSFRKAMIVFALSAALVAGGVVIAPERPVIGWTCIGFFGLGIPLSLLMMWPTSTFLKLDRKGFEISAMFRKARFRWSDVTGFRVSALYGNKIVAIDYSQDFERQKTARAVAGRLTGMEGAIPDHYKASVEEICRALNEWKARYGGGTK